MVPRSLIQTVTERYLSSSLLCSFPINSKVTVLIKDLIQIAFQSRKRFPLTLDQIRHWLSYYRRWKYRSANTHSCGNPVDQMQYQLSILFVKLIINNTQSPIYISNEHPNLAIMMLRRTMSLISVWTGSPSRCLFLSRSQQGHSVLQKHNDTPRTAPWSPQSSTPVKKT